MEQLGRSYTVAGLKLAYPLKKTIFQYLGKLNICIARIKKCIKDMYTAALLIIAGDWKLAPCLSILEWVSKLKYIYVIGYHMAMRL